MGAGAKSERLFSFRDDAMFKRVMRNQKICKGVIGRIIGRQVDKVEYLETQAEQLAWAGAKEPRMDVYVVESGGTLYDVEMQVRKSKYLPMRFRGYQSIMDAAHLKPGQGYQQLRESWIVFICVNDPFGFGRPVYRIERYCRDEPQLDFDCKARWVVLNASAWSTLPEDDGLRELLEYVLTDKVVAGDELVEAIDAEVDLYNGNGWSDMMFDSVTVARWDGLDEGLEKGLEQGLEQGQERYARLVSMLMDAGRLNDLRVASSDPKARDRLFEELGI